MLKEKATNTHYVRKSDVCQELGYNSFIEVLKKAKQCRVFCAWLRANPSNSLTGLRRYDRYITQLELKALKKALLIE